MRIPALLLGLAAAALLAAGVAGEPLSGKLILVAKRGRKGLDPRQGVIAFRPRAGATTSPAATPLVMATRDKAFEPRVLAVPLGSQVRFPNLDPILHNVFSVSGKNAFDLGLYRKGPGEVVTFAHPGLVRIFCNVHREMVAYAVVLDTPHFTAADADGAFVLENVPPGPGTLTVWHERAEPWSSEVAVPLPGPLTIELDASRPKVPHHLDKLGKPYGRRNDRDYG